MLVPANPAVEERGDRDDHKIENAIDHEKRAQTEKDIQKATSQQLADFVADFPVFSSRSRE